MTEFNKYDTPIFSYVHTLTIFLFELVYKSV